MFAIPEQFSAATKASFEAQFASFTALTSKTLESVEKLIDLNLKATKASIDDSTAIAKQLLEVKDPQDFLNLTSAQVQPAAEKAVAYGRTLAGIASDVQSEVSKAAEAQISEHSAKVIALVDEVSKNAPAGSETAVALFKSAVGNANAGYEQLSKTAKKASEAIEANVNSVVDQVTANIVKPTTRSKKAA